MGKVRFRGYYHTKLTCHSSSQTWNYTLSHTSCNYNPLTPLYTFGHPPASPPFSSSTPISPDKLSTLQVTVGNSSPGPSPQSRRRHRECSLTASQPDIEPRNSGPTARFAFDGTKSKLTRKQRLRWRAGKSAPALSLGSQRPPGLRGAGAQDRLENRRSWPGFHFSDCGLHFPEGSEAGDSEQRCVNCTSGRGGGVPGERGSTVLARRAVPRSRRHAGLCSWPDLSRAPPSLWRGLR